MQTLSRLARGDYIYLAEQGQPFNGGGMDLAELRQTLEDEGIPEYSYSLSGGVWPYPYTCAASVGIWHRFAGRVAHRQ